MSFRREVGRQAFDGTVIASFVLLRVRRLYYCWWSEMVTLSTDLSLCLVIWVSTLYGPATNTSCIQRFNVPNYPALADMAKVAADVKASVVLGRDSAVDRITTEVTGGNGSTQRVFREAVEKAVRASAFKPECVARTVELVFSFSLVEAVATGGSQQTITFSYPNRFSIVIAPKALNP